jgi:hypothetical protein
VRRQARPPHSRGRTLSHRRQTERRQVQPVQRARRCAGGHRDAIAGTTRDLVTETADVDGLRLELIDTAGVRDRTTIEREGVSRARGAWEAAD